MINSFTDFIYIEHQFVDEEKARKETELVFRERKQEEPVGQCLFSRE